MTKPSRGHEDEVVIVPGQCGQANGTFGIRFECRGRGTWVATWAFPLRAEAISREGYGTQDISGRFEFASEFPGCPHCQNSSFFRCQCGHLVCHDGESRRVRCPSCGMRGDLAGAVDQLRAGFDA